MLVSIWGAVGFLRGHFSEWSGKVLFKEEDDYVGNAALAPGLAPGPCL